jgi:hypothetical protein
MPEEMSEHDLKERLVLVESMIAEGRRSTERWGWTFVLWGVAYYVAMAWSAWGPMSNLAWPVTMIAATGLNVAIAMSRPHLHVETTVGRAIGSVWVAMGISTFLFFVCLGFSGRFEMHVFVAIVATMLGTANATSSLVLKWKMQFACAVVWWATVVAACFGSDAILMGAFVAAIFICQIVFGIYGMIADSRKPKSGAVHA